MDGFKFQLSSFNMYDAWFSMIMVIGYYLFMLIFKDKGPSRAEALS